MKGQTYTEFLKDPENSEQSKRTMRTLRQTTEMLLSGPWGANGSEDDSIAAEIGRLKRTIEKLERTDGGPF